MFFPICNLFDFRSILNIVSTIISHLLAVKMDGNTATGGKNDNINTNEMHDAIMQSLSNHFISNVLLQTLRVIL